MQRSSKKRKLVLATLWGFGLALAAWRMSRPGVSVVISDPNFRIHEVRVCRGNRHELPRNVWALEMAARALARFGLAALPASMAVPTDEGTYSLAVLFDGKYPPNGLARVRAEIVDDFGCALPQWPLAMFGSDSSPYNRYGKLWQLDRPLTNAITVVLRAGINQPVLAQIRIAAR